MSISESQAWSYFLTIEAELSECSRYVDFQQDNFGCYSKEFAKIIFLTGAEVDSLLLAVCRDIDRKTLGQYPNIGNFRNSLSRKHPAFRKRRVRLPLHQLDLSALGRLLAAIDQIDVVGYIKKLSI